MKAFKYSAIVIATFFLFAGCQKEFSLDDDGIFKNPAAGSLKNASGDCFPVTVKGNYLSDSVITDSNYVIVQVNFSSTGSYDISTDTSNGFSFHASGNTPGGGLQNIILKGTGKPILAQPTNFSVTFDTSVCTFSIAVSDSAGGEKAVYSLAGSPGNCADFKVNGSYQEGTPLDTANKVSIQVNVADTGRFSIYTDLTNGMTFTAQGSFSKTGLQTVTLQGSGTPATAGTNKVPINAGGTTCSFNVAVSSFKPPAPDSAWQFTEGRKFYHGFIDSAFTHIVPELDSATVLSFYGYSYTGTDTLFQLDILLEGTSIQTGTYNTDSANADFYLYNRDTSLAPVYEAYYTITPEVNIEIIISSYNRVTKIVRGTFSGTAVNASGQKVTITGGKIYAKLN